MLYIACIFTRRPSNGNCFLHSLQCQCQDSYFKKKQPKTLQKPQQKSKQNPASTNQAWMFNFKAIFRLRRSEAMTHDFYFFQSHDCQQIK